MIISCAALERLFLNSNNINIGVGLLKIAEGVQSLKILGLSNNNLRSLLVAYYKQCSVLHI